MKKSFQSVRGTSDLYPPDTSFFQKIITTGQNICRLFDYRLIKLPHLEEKGLFRKGVGGLTDISQKQIFEIKDKDIVLRPEGTAQVARAYIQKKLYKQKKFCKFYYIGSMFRGERPQKGRLREFNHIGAEAIGSNSFYLDAEIIDLAMRIITEVGVKKFKLKINSLGCVDDKKKLTKLINEKLSPKKDMLCSNCQRRVNDNPLRVIDCKNPRCQKEVKSLKLGKKHLCPECQNHFEQVLSQLDAYNIDYDYDPLLVRGLDYYTNTVFEIVSAGLGSQSAIGAGGRYNQLIASLGGTEVPAVGFALGVERMMLLLDKKYQKSPKMVSVAYTSDETKSHAYKLVHKLRINGIAATIDYCNKSLKAQLKLASKNKTPVTLIVGDQELKQNCILVRNMAESSQEKIKTKDLIKTLKEQLK